MSRIVLARFCTEGSRGMNIVAVDPVEVFNHDTIDEVKAKLKVDWAKHDVRMEAIIYTLVTPKKKKKEKAEEGKKEKAKARLAPKKKAKKDRRVWAKLVPKKAMKAMKAKKVNN